MLGALAQRGDLGVEGVGPRGLGEFGKLVDLGFEIGDRVDWVPPGKRRAT